MDFSLGFFILPGQVDDDPSLWLYPPQRRRASQVTDAAVLYVGKVDETKVQAYLRLRSRITTINQTYPESFKQLQDSVIDYFKAAIELFVKFKFEFTELPGEDRDSLPKESKYSFVKFGYKLYFERIISAIGAICEKELERHTRNRICMNKKNAAKSVKFVEEAVLPLFDRVLNELPDMYKPQAEVDRLKSLIQKIPRSSASAFSSSRASRKTFLMNIAKPT